MCGWQRLGALDVAKGAFRLTTAAAAGMRSSRDLSIRVGTATAGIVSLGGTDLWGKSDSERDLILLIEGKISLRHIGEAVAIEPMTLFVSPRNAAPRRPMEGIAGPRRQRSGSASRF